MCDIKIYILNNFYSQIYLKILSCYNYILHNIKERILKIIFQDITNSERIWKQHRFVCWKYVHDFVQFAIQFTYEQYKYGAIVTSIIL